MCQEGAGAFSRITLVERAHSYTGNSQWKLNVLLQIRWQIPLSQFHQNCRFEAAVLWLALAQLVAGEAGDAA